MPDLASTIEGAEFDDEGGFENGGSDFLEQYRGGFRSTARRHIVW